MSDKDFNIEEETNKFFKQFQKLIEMRELSLVTLSDTDTKLSSLYHKIEGIEITHISQSHNLIKELKSVLTERRLAKKNCMLSQSVVDTMKRQIESAKKQRTNILNRHQALEDEIKTRAKT
jgi:predicted transcriptional regulator